MRFYISGKWGFSLIWGCLFASFLDTSEAKATMARFSHWLLRWRFPTLPWAYFSLTLLHARCLGDHICSQHSERGRGLYAGRSSTFSLIYILMILNHPNPKCFQRAKKESTRLYFNLLAFFCPRGRGHHGDCLGNPGCLQPLGWFMPLSSFPPRHLHVLCPAARHFH